MILAFYRGKNASCHEWNQMGAIHPSGLKFLNFDKPIYYMSNHTETDILINRVSHFNFLYRQQR